MIQGIKHPAQIIGHFSPHALSWYKSLRILLQMKLAALLGNPAKHSLAVCFQPQVIVSDDQLHPTQLFLNQILHKGSPLHLILAQRTRDAQNCPSPVSSHT
jgi:hypothetical protein